MIHGIYSIHDRRVGYLSPTEDDSDIVAIRNFEHSVLRSGSLLDSHPEDFTLIRLAWFDSLNGSFHMCHPSDPDDSSLRCPSPPLADAYSIVQASIGKGGVRDYV